MRETPEPPRQVTADLEASELDDSPFPSNRRQRTRVTVPERRRVPPLHPCSDHLRDVPSFLLRHRGDSGQGLAVHVEHMSRVADREDVGMSGDTKVRRNLDAACSVPLGPQPSGRLRGLDARTPDDGAGFDPLVCEQDAGVVAARDHRRKPDLDSEFLERALGDL